MKNLKLRKILLTICSAMLLVTLSVGATFAYLTSTATVTNTFTVGKVAITLDETDVDVYGEKKSENRVKANTYKLMPGHTYIKDPTIHVDTTSEDAWLGVKVVFEGGKKVDDLGLPMLEIFDVNASDWTIREKTYEGNNVAYVLVYNKSVTKNENVVLFEKMVIPGTLSNANVEALNDIKMNITAYAVQKDGFTDAAAALDAGFDDIF